LTKPLTAAAVAKYRAGPKRRRIRDVTKGLFLIVAPSGKKSWQMRFRTPSGRIGKLTLGDVDLSGRELKEDPEIGQSLTVAAARQLAARVHRERALGHDPVAANKARRHRLRAELIDRRQNTFGAAVRVYIKDYVIQDCANPKQRRWRETARLLGLDPVNLVPKKGGLAQRWEAKPVSEVDAHEIWSVVDEARKRGVPGLEARNKGISEARARALHAALSAFFGWLQRQRRVTNNPVAGISKPSAPAARERYLSHKEIQLLWKACDTVGEPFSSIFRLLLLLGQRLNEVAGMRRDELSHDGTTWNLPGDRTKNKRPHTVPLPPLAQAIIAAIPGHHQIIFSTGKQKGETPTPPSGWNRAKRELDAAMLAIARKERGADATIPYWRLHDLRRTAVTGMAELSIRPDVIELIVNHVSGARGGIAGVYNRSELMDERRVALTRWAAQVAGIVNADVGKVVELRTKMK
jgi:integrase